MGNRDGLKLSSCSPDECDEADVAFLGEPTLAELLDELDVGAFSDELFGWVDIAEVSPGAVRITFTPREPDRSPRYRRTEYVLTLREG